ncbi:MAG: hypothetical protein LJE68_01475 [Rhodobacter sp.]|nr:hypothetical protein [Rhodobacter sp.]
MRGPPTPIENPGLIDREVARLYSRSAPSQWVVGQWQTRKVGWHSIAGFMIVRPFLRTKGQEAGDLFSVIHLIWPLFFARLS